MTNDLPAVLVSIGDFDVDKVIDLELRSKADAPLDWLDLEIDNRDGEASAFAEGDDVELRLGYMDDATLPVVFRGQVERVRRGRTVALEVVDVGAAVRDLQLVSTWINTTPQDIAADVFARAGLLGSKTATTQERRPYVVSCDLSGLVLLDTVARAWRLDWQLYFEPTGAAWWGPWAESPRAQASDIHVFRFGEDLIELQPEKGKATGRLVTHCRPDVRHSELGYVVDPEFAGEQVLVRFDRVTHRLGREGYTSEMEWTRSALPEAA